MIRRKWKKKVNPQTRHLDDLMREIVFHRDEYKCWDCQRAIDEVLFRKEDGWPWYPGFQLAHVFGRMRGSMKWSPDNANCSCGRCHELWHDERFKPAKLHKFTLLHPERWAMLEEAASRPVERVDRRQLTEDLEHALNAVVRKTLAWERGWDRLSMGAI